MPSDQNQGGSQSCPSSVFPFLSLHPSPQVSSSRLAQNQTKVDTVSYKHLCIVKTVTESPLIYNTGLNRPPPPKLNKMKPTISIFVIALMVRVISASPAAKPTIVFKDCRHQCSCDRYDSLTKLLKIYNSAWPGTKQQTTIDTNEPTRRVCSFDFTDPSACQNIGQSCMNNNFTWSAIA